MIHKNIKDIQALPTSHGAGMKKVLIAPKDTPSNITQIAHTTMEAGEHIKGHTHSDMEEHFYIEQGSGRIVLDGVDYPMQDGDYFYVPAGVSHELFIGDTPLVMMTIGVVLNKDSKRL